MGYRVVRPEMKWQRQPRSARDLVLMGLLVVVAVCLIRRGAQLQTQESQLVFWAGTPVGAEQAAAAPPARHVAEALRPYRPRPHAPPTWRQEREWARADLQSLCKDARHMAAALDPHARAPFWDIRDATAVWAVNELRPALLHAARQQARLKAQLDRARGFADIYAIQHDMWAVRNPVYEARSWFRAHRQRAIFGMPRGRGGRRPAGDG